MIIAVTLNPTLDRTLEVASLAPGEVHRVTRSSSVAGGKGINVARVLRSLGGDPLAVGLLGGETGKLLAKHVEDEGISSRWVWTGGETRSNVTIVDEASGKETHFRETGPRVSEEETRVLERQLEGVVRSNDFVVLSGSLPEGLPSGYYARLVEFLHARGARVALDSSGPALAAGAGARPELIKPNAEELQDTVERALSQTGDFVEAIRELVARGVGAVVVSRGAKSVLAGSSEGAWEAVPPRVKPVNAVGSGDALLAGVLRGLELGRALDGAVRLGAACGAANTLVSGAGLLRMEDVRRLESEVEVRAIA